MAVYLTRKGYDLLDAELLDLLLVRRPTIVADITQSREFGDVSENAEYEIAKRDQAVVEGRIKELENLMATARILELPESVSEAALGVRVQVEHIESGRQCDYTLVSEYEAHLEAEYLSVESPLGEALLGAKVGDVVTFQAPAGIRSFRVLELSGCDNGN